MALGQAAPPGSIITDRRSPPSVAAVANYAPRPTCPPGSVAFDNRGTWQCREIVSVDGGASHSHGVVVPPTKPQKPEPPSVGSGQEEEVLMSIGLNTRFGGGFSFNPGGFGLPNVGGPTPPSNLPTGGLTGNQLTVGDIAGTLGAAGCSRLPQSLQAACLAAAGALTGQSQQQTTGSNLPAPQDPTPGTVTPAEMSVGMTGMVAPYAQEVRRLTCPKFADGKTGILWMNAMTGAVACLPRGVNGGKFGLIRKNKKRPKAYISAADVKMLRKADRLQKKAKDFAKLTGQTCKKRGR